MFLHVSVILFMGGSAPLHAGIHIPLGPEAGAFPWDQRQAPPPTGGRHPPGTRGKHHLPGPDPPPSAVHAGRYRQQAGVMHPTGMQSCYGLFSRLTDNSEYVLQW